MISPCLIPWVQKCDSCTWYFSLWEEFYSPRHAKGVMLFIFFKALPKYPNSQAFNKVRARDVSFWHPRTKPGPPSHWQLQTTTDSCLSHHAGILQLHTKPTSRPVARLLSLCWDHSLEWPCLTHEKRSSTPCPAAPESYWKVQILGCSRHRSL